MIKYDKGLWFHEEPTKFSRHGTKTIKAYVLDYPSRGGVALKEVGEKPIYEMIQKELDNCDLKNVIESCVHNNQYAVCSPDNLNTVVADFTALTNMNSLGELYAHHKVVENTWLDLPLEVREQFNSDIKQFINAFGSDEFDDKVNKGFVAFNDAYKKVHKVPTNDTIINPISDDTVTIEKGEITNES